MLTGLPRAYDAAGIGPLTTRGTLLEVLLSNMPYIPPGWGVAVELFVMLLVVRKLLLERSLQVKHFSKLGPKGIDYHSLPVINFGLCMCALHLVDCVVFVHFRPNFRLAFVARTGCARTIRAEYGPHIAISPRKGGGGEGRRVRGEGARGAGYGRAGRGGKPRRQRSGTPCGSGTPWHRRSRWHRGPHGTAAGRGAPACH